MDPSTIPRGRLARNAWRALSPQARKTAFAGTKDGALLSDLHVAWAAAGYGRLVSRRLQILRVLWPFVALVLVVPATIAIVELGATPTVAQVIFIPVIVGIIGGIFGISAWGQRYQRLYSGGLLTIEAARIAGPARPPAPSGWETANTESEFTVPYNAHVPAIEPLAPLATDPAAAGVHEIPIHRAPVLVYLAVLLGVGVAFWAFVIGLWAGDSRVVILASVVTLCVIAYTMLIVVLLYAVGPALIRPVNARFTPEGWQLPAAGMGGTWAEVRAIRVRPLSTRGTMGGAPQLATVRVVALVVDDPQAHLARLAPIRRWMTRRNLTKYGSPIVIVATQRRSMPVVDLVQLLTRYTSAPVEWT
jgi:hypothetical protein